MNISFQDLWVAEGFLLKTKYQLADELGYRFDCFGNFSNGTHTIPDNIVCLLGNRVRKSGNIQHFVGRPYFPVFYNGTTYNLPVDIIERVVNKIDETSIPQGLKRGDKVWVKDIGDSQWVERIYLATIKGAMAPFICVLGADENAFYAGKPFGKVSYESLRGFPQEKKKKVLKAPAIYRNTAGPYITDTLYGSEAEASDNGTKKVFISWPATLWVNGSATPMWVEIEE